MRHYTSIDTAFAQLGLLKAEWTDEHAREKPGHMTFDWNGSMKTNRGTAGVQLRYFNGGVKNATGAWLAITVNPNE